MTSTDLSEPLPSLTRCNPFWERIAAELVSAIAKGVYAPGQRLPSEHVLARQFGVNRHTVRRALASLSGQGMLKTNQGSGTYVQPFALDLALGRRVRAHETLERAGLVGTITVTHADTISATARLARKLALAEGSPLLQLKVLLDSAGMPLQISERYFPLPRFAGLDAVVRASGSITEAFKACGVADYTRLSSRIGADMPDAALAWALQQAPTRPVLTVESVNVDSTGRPIEFARAWFAADRVTFTVMQQDFNP